MNPANASFMAKLTQGSGLLFTANLLSKALTILMLPLLTALLPPELYGEAALAGTLISLASMLALAGMDVSYARAYFGAENASGAQVEMLIWRRGFWHALAAAVFAALIWVAYSRFQLGMHTELASLVALGVFGTLFVALAQVRARLLGHYRRMAAGILIASLLGYAVIFVFALRPESAAFALVAGSVVLVWVSGLSQKLPNAGKLLNNAEPTDAATAHKILAVGLPVMLTAPAFWIVGSADRWFLGVSATTAEVGIYAIGVSFGTLGMMLNSAVLSAWVPEIIREYESNADNSYKAFGQAKRLLILAYAFVWVAIVALSPELIRLLVDARYHEAMKVVPWIAGGVFFYGCAHLFNTVFLLERRLTITAVIWAVAIVLSLACNAWAVPHYGMLGAAVVQCLVFGIVAFMHWWYSQKIKRIAIFSPVYMLKLSALFAIGYFGQNIQLENVIYSVAVKSFALTILAPLILWWMYRGHSLQAESGKTT